MTRVKKSAVNPPLRLAVIDIGSSSVRMDIVEVTPLGKMTTLDSLTQAVTLGKDTFTRGYIKNSTLEECIKALVSFKKILREYQIEPINVKTVASSALREAENRDASLDRITMATGFQVQVLDESEINRYVFLSVHPALNTAPINTFQQIIITETGAGNTTLLHLNNGLISFSYNYRQGAIRLRKMCEGLNAESKKMYDIINNTILRTIEQIWTADSAPKNCAVVLQGGDARFAASYCSPKWDKHSTIKIPVESLKHLTDTIMNMSVDTVVSTFSLSYPDAETLGPALLSYVNLARSLSVKHVFVVPVSMRDGIVEEMVMPTRWNKEFRDQLLHCAFEIAKKYETEISHVTHVCKLAQKLFTDLTPLHQLSSRYELILSAAAVLHDVGLFISNRSHHHHSMYIILNCNLFGLGAKEVMLVALTARYHRRAMPNSSHDEYNSLDRESRVAVSKMAAILRIADSLDRTHTHSIMPTDILVKHDRVILNIKKVPDLPVIKIAVRQKGDLFEKIFGVPIEIN